MEYKIPEGLGQLFAQSDAAALAVIVAHVRKNNEELYEEHCVENQRQNPGAIDPEQSESERVGCAFLQELEAIACNSIASNDGNVVHWIGTAAKQMNPLLS
jgi:hypothetical protein